MVALSTYNGGYLNAGSLAYQAAFNGSDLNSLGAGCATLSTLAAFDNTGGVGGTPDEFMDVSFVGALATAAALTAGASLGLAIAYLNGDGTTYGDGRLQAGPNPTTVANSYLPVMDVVQGITFPLSSTAVTTLINTGGLIALRPQKFKLIVTSNLTGALAASGNMLYISTYKLRNDAPN